jgi:hypothetical protein
MYMYHLHNIVILGTCIPAFMSGQQARYQIKADIPHKPRLLPLSELLDIITLLLYQKQWISRNNAYLLSRAQRLAHRVDT